MSTPFEEFRRHLPREFDIERVGDLPTEDPATASSAGEATLAESVDRFITDAMNRGIIPTHVAADLSQYLVVEWS